MRRIALAAPAKLNLHLGIHTELDERRYHKAESLMVALDLADEVVVEELAQQKNASVGPEIVCEPSVDVPPQKNTAYRAACELGARVGRVPNVRVTIHKRVPDQAGMGGSSSDAAAVLRALCELWGVETRDPAVADAARSVGADVPFFLDPVPTLLVGAGDVVSETFAPLAESVPVVLVRPNGPGVSTPAAYAAFDANPTPPADPAGLCAVLRSGATTGAELASRLANNLDPVACALLLSVAEVRAWLLAREDVLGGQVTGSGSCVFGICASDEAAENVVRAARERFAAWAHVAHIR